MATEKAADGATGETNSPRNMAETSGGQRRWTAVASRPTTSFQSIKQIGPTLSRSEQRVATTVLADVDFAVHSSNAELARRAGVSEPTVTRFSRSVGCRGVRELKVRLAQAMAVGRIYLELPPHVGTDLERPALWRSVFQEIRRAISAVEEQLQKEDVEKAAEAIARCSKLAAFGVGGGSTVAVAEVENRFFRLGIAVYHSSDPRLMLMNCGNARPRRRRDRNFDHGSAAEVIEAATVAKQYGALIIAIDKAAKPACRNRGYFARRAHAGSAGRAQADGVTLCASCGDRPAGCIDRISQAARGAGADAAHQVRIDEGTNGDADGPLGD